MKGNRRKIRLIGIVGIAIATALAVLAADKKPADQTLVRLKVGGKIVAELRVLDAGALSVTGEQVNHVKASSTTTAKEATIQFGGASGKSITIKAEEVEIVRSKESLIDDLVSQRITSEYGDRAALVRMLQAKGLTFEAFRQQVKQEVEANSMTAPPQG
jgi:hypothetical protein